MFRDIQIDLIILKTDDKQFTLAAEKKSLLITFKFQQLVGVSCPFLAQIWLYQRQ